ncbi:ABC transporter permease [Corynebacterium diphtheriae]
MFFNALKSEWTKLMSLRSTAVYFILITGALYGPMVLLVGLADTSSGVDWSSLLVGWGIAVAISTAFAGASVAGELDDHMHAHAYLTQNSRSTWIAAKSVVYTVFLAITFAIGIGLAVAVAQVFPDSSFSGGETTDLFIALFHAIIFGSFAFAIGMLTRSKVAAVAFPLAWMLVIDQLIPLAASKIEAATFLWLLSPRPRSGQLADTIAGTVETGMEHGFELGQIQPDWFNVAVIAGWVVVATVSVFAVNRVRDIR